MGFVGRREADLCVRVFRVWRMGRRGLLGRMSEGGCWMWWFELRGEDGWENVGEDEELGIGCWD